ncbi:hypothetical protein ACFQS2_00340 [Brachybacterium sp. GCM10030267]|uniref:hypothetical protein n=1 Tax=Brachybacterium sp. GCM10030267 TaxID=3273381 RepID=UPI00360CD887
MDTHRSHRPHPQDEPADIAATWRDQQIELVLPGVGAITACADPRLFQDPDPEPRAEPDEGFRRREPTTPPDPGQVRAALQARPPLELEHTWLVVPALGPVLPTQQSEGMIVADLSGCTSPGELRPGVPGREPGVKKPARSSREHWWYRVPSVAAALRERGAMAGHGALVGSGREWFEPAVAAREDLLAAHPDQALEVALNVAREHGQAAVIRLGPAGLDVIPTGADPRVPHLEAIDVLVTARPPRCPLRGTDDAEPCRPHGGPWIEAAQRAQVSWEARRSQALAVQECGVCFGEALPPEPDQPQLPRLALRTPVPFIDRLHLRSGEEVRIDPLR